jgi:hypothetical protein
MNGIKVLVNPTIAADQLFAFYEKNDICEVGYGKDVAAKVLEHSSIIVGAFEGDRLVGIARAMFDGLDAVIMELSLDLDYQGEGLTYDNGSLLEKDPTGLGKRIAETLLNELISRGAYFFEAIAVENVTEDFLKSVGFTQSEDHVRYIIDRRPNRLN